MNIRFSKALAVGGVLITSIASTNASAQTASSDVQADIAAPSSVTRLADLQFGDIIAGSAPSSVVVEPFLETRTVLTGDAVVFGGTVSAAEFEVNARPLLFYQIALPASTTITRSGGSETMLVNNFTLDGPSIRLLPLFTNIGNFKVGGRLNVGAAQTNGNYSGSFSVSVNYF